MLENLLWVMNKVRETIFESFILPDLGISYWDFCLSLLVIGLVIRVLVNGVPSSHRSKNAKRDKGNKQKASEENASE